MVVGIRTFVAVAVHGSRHHGVNDVLMRRPRRSRSAVCNEHRMMKLQQMGHPPYPSGASS